MKQQKLTSFDALADFRDKLKSQESQNIGITENKKIEDKYKAKENHQEEKISIING